MGGERAGALQPLRPGRGHRLFGSEAESRVLCDGQWVIFSDVVIGFTEVGEPPRMSHFTRAEGDDPPVFGRRETTDPWEPEGLTLAEHLIVTCLFEAVMCHAPYKASASWVSGTVLNRIIEHIPPIPINPWRWVGSLRFYAKGGAFMHAAPNGEIDGDQDDSVTVGAKTEGPLRFLKPYVDERWEFVAIGSDGHP